MVSLYTTVKRSMNSKVVFQHVLKNKEDVKEVDISLEFDEKE
jgi:hypothetical protein